MGAGRGGEVARRSDRGGGGLRVLSGGPHGGGRAHGHRPLQLVLLLAGRSRRTSRLTFHFCVCIPATLVSSGAGALTSSSGRPPSQTEVEVEGRVVSRKGKLTAAAVEVRKKDSGELVAVGRQWVTPAWPTKANKTSKL